MVQSEDVMAPLQVGDDQGDAVGAQDRVLPAIQRERRVANIGQDVDARLDDDAPRAAFVGVLDGLCQRAGVFGVAHGGEGGGMDGRAADGEGGEGKQRHEACL